MELGVKEAAGRLGVSPRRVRQLLESGDLPGRQVGRRWLISEESLQRTARQPRRPLAQDMAWQLLLDEIVDPSAHPEVRARIRRMRNQLAHSPDPAGLLRAWTRNRANRASWHVANADLPDLPGDSRVVASGISDPRAEMSAAQTFEGYVSAADLDDLVGDYLLVADQIGPNVLLHVVHDTAMLGQAVPLLVVAADLADRDQPRENQRAAELVGTWATAT